MKEAIPLEEFVANIEQMKITKGITDQDIENARNNGQRRTKEKKAQLQRIQDRAIANSLKPYPANY